jgi:Holliday junction resolvasome RuvABC endonuclease subunit
LVVYEEVRVTPPEKLTRYNATLILARAATSAELIGAYKTTVCTWCEEHNVPCTGFPIGTIKKRATGRGNANKEEMIRAANETFGLGLAVEGYESTGVDNIADAIWVCLLGMENYGAGLRVDVASAADVGGLIS